MTHATPWVARAINDLASVITAALNRLPICTGAGNLSGHPGRWCRPLSKEQSSHFHEQAVPSGKHHQGTRTEDSAILCFCPARQQERAGLSIVDFGTSWRTR